MQKTRGFEKADWSKEAKDFKMPERASSKSAGYDIYYCGKEQIDIYPLGTSPPIPTGVKAFMKEDEFLLLSVARPLGLNRNLQLAVSTGVVDSENSEEIVVKLRNMDSKAVQSIRPGEKLALGIFQKCLAADEDCS